MNKKTLRLKLAGVFVIALVAAACTPQKSENAMETPPEAQAAEVRAQPEADEKLPAPGSFSEDGKIPSEDFSSDEFFIEYKTLPNGTMADTRIPEDAAAVIVKYFEAIENGDLTAFRSTLKYLEDGVDLYYQMGLIYKYFGDFFDVDAAAFNHAIETAEGLDPIINTVFSSEFPLRSRNTGLFIKEMEIVTDHAFIQDGYNELVKAVVTNNKNEEAIYHLYIVDSETHEGTFYASIGKQFE